MNTENLNAIIKQYIDRFDELNALDGNDEGYKWRAVSCFKSHWDINAADFPDMFKAAMKDTSNLIDNKTVQPIGGINELLKHNGEVEYVRKCFRELFSDDGGDLEQRQKRIEVFADKINARIDNYVHGSWKYPQAINNVIYYLNLWQPENNYIFKSTEAFEWAGCIEYGDDFGSGQSFSLRRYYKMCDELLAELPHYDTLMQIHQKRFEAEAHDFDDNLHILVYDIIYCAHAYNFYTGMNIRKVSTKERIEIAKQRDEQEGLAQQLAEKEKQLSSLENLASEKPNLKGSIVKHNTFGTGTVSDFTNGTVLVDFTAVQKKFIYPDAFLNGFLKCDDEKLIEQIKQNAAKGKDISEIKKEISALKLKISKP